MSDREKTLIDFGLLVLRVVLGVTFILHGLPKMYDFNTNQIGVDKFAATLAEMQFPVPKVSAWLAAVAETGGGLLVMVGLLPRIGALAIAGVMFVAIAKVHLRNGFFLQNNGYEFALNLLAMALAIVLAGAGRYSLAGLMRKGNGD